jgi:hypothetical protein
MNAIPNVNMSEVMRLTQAGQLTEAMAVLRGVGSDQSGSASRNTEPTIDMVPPSKLGGAWTPPEFTGSGFLGAMKGGKRGFRAGPELPSGMRAVLDRVGKLGSGAGFGGLSGSHPARPAAALPEGARFEERSFSNEAGTREITRSTFRAATRANPCRSS